MTDEAQDRENVRARMAHALGQLAGHMPKVPYPGDHCLAVGNENFTWLDMLLLVEVKEPLQYTQQDDKPLSNEQEKK